MLNNCLVSRLISIARRNLTVPRAIPETICPNSETIYFHLRRPVVKALGGKNWPSSINLAFPRSASLHSCVTWANIDTHTHKHTPLQRAVYPTPRRKGESINDSCSVTASLAFDGLPFIESSPPHETVISQ